VNGTFRLHNLRGAPQFRKIITATSEAQFEPNLASVCMSTLENRVHSCSGGWHLFIYLFNPFDYTVDSLRKWYKYVLSQHWSVTRSSLCLLHCVAMNTCLYTFASISSAFSLASCSMKAIICLICKQGQETWMRNKACDQNLYWTTTFFQRFYTLSIFEPLKVL